MAQFRILAICFVVLVTGRLGYGFRTSGMGGNRMNMSYKKVFIAGGSSGVGREVVNKLVAAGKQVVAIVRRPEALEALNAINGVTAVMVDALDLKGVEGALDGCDAAITTLGGSTSIEEGVTVDYAGNRNVIESAGILGVTRILLVTSVGCGDSKDAISEQVYSSLKESLVAKTKAEKMLQKYYTNSFWTIIRPGGLKTAPPTNNAILTEDKTIAGIITREDVADLIVRCLDNEATVQKVFTAIDPSIVSSFGADKKVEAFPL